MDSATEIQTAIDDSVARDAIARLPWTQEREDALLAVADDHTDAGTYIDAWADSDEQGDDSMKWRVYLVRE